MGKIIARHKLFWVQQSAYANIALSLLLLFVSLLLNYGANVYIESRVNNAVADIILDNLPVIDVSAIFILGYVFLLALVLIVLLYEPQQVPFLLKSIALFIIIRAVFITLTHLGKPVGGLFLDQGTILGKLTTGDDLFFSGHTGMPFLFALLYWDHKRLRLMFIALSLIFGFSVLLGHLHYSIDVFAAFFITYGIFIMATKFFKKDYKLFLKKV